MPAVAALLERRPAMLALRRALVPSDLRLITARSPAHLATLLTRHFFDTLVLGSDAARGPALDALRRDFPALPLLLYAPLRSDDAELLQRLHRARGLALAVEGVDEPILPRLLCQQSLTARRSAELLPLAARLDLTDPLQHRAWAMVIAEAPFGLTAATVAQRCRLRRETVSRRFSAGGAPSLKRAIDAVRLVAAGQLLANPGYRVADAARLLRFSSVSLLQQTARRTLGVSAREIPTLDGARVAERLLADRESPGWA